MKSPDRYPRPPLLASFNLKPLTQPAPMPNRDDFVIPDWGELHFWLSQLDAALTESRPVFRFFPVQVSHDNELIWEEDDRKATTTSVAQDIGLQQVRGIGGSPCLLAIQGDNLCPTVSSVEKGNHLVRRMESGRYGEYIVFDRNLLEQFRLALGQPADLGPALFQVLGVLVERGFDRMEAELWQMLSGHSFSPLHGGIRRYGVHAWRDAVTAAKQAKSVDFGYPATAFMNEKTFQRFCRIEGHAFCDELEQTIQNVNDENSRLNLPRIKVYDDGYLDAVGSFRRFVPDWHIIVCGARERVLGQYRVTRNANNPDLEPGSYTRLIWQPMLLELHRGHNGGPVCFCPSGVACIVLG